MFYFDAHCHILPEKQIKKAFHSGISYMICNATMPENWDKIISMSEKYAGIYPCIGIHPWFIDELRPDWLVKMQWLLEKYPNMMIGEIGLDGTYPNLTRQAEIFENCLNLAHIYHRPVHIHGHKAWQNISDILSCHPKVTCLYHRFTGSSHIADKLMQVSDAWFSVMTSKPVGFLSPDRILVESDSPDGLHNPARIIELVDKLGLDKSQLAHNFCRFVGTFVPMTGVHPCDYTQ